MSYNLGYGGEGKRERGGTICFLGKEGKGGDERGPRGAGSLKKASHKFRGGGESGLHGKGKKGKKRCDPPLKKKKRGKM